MEYSKLSNDEDRAPEQDILAKLEVDVALATDWDSMTINNKKRNIFLPIRNEN